MRSTRYDELFERGREAVLAGRVDAQEPPVDDGPRWGMSVILRPTPDVAARLGALTDEAMALAGPGHWPTGAAHSVHVTLRALERHRTAVPDDDPRAARYLDALRTAAAGIGPIRLALTGLTLTPSSVMLATDPDGTAIERLSSAFGEALGDDGRYEADRIRTIRHSNLVHFTGPIARPRALVDWVADRRLLDLGDSVHRTAELMVWRHREGSGMHADTLANVPLNG